MEEMKRKNDLEDKTNAKQIAKPEDVFRKRSHSFLGSTVHEYLGLPGKYMGNIENEIPDGENNERRTDGGYKVKLDDDEMIISIEDESTKIDTETLAKTFGYCLNIQYAYNLPVHSVITTPLPLEKCTKYYCPSQTLKYMPEIISFNEFDGNKKLQQARAKVNNHETFSAVEGYDLINTVRMFDKGNDEILEEVCELFTNMNIDNKFIKFELGKCLECMISKYAKTMEDIKRLNEVISMTSNIEVEQYMEELREEGREEMRKEMRKEREELARKFAKEIGLEKTMQISGLSKEQILKG